MNAPLLVQTTVRDAHGTETHIGYHPTTCDAVAAHNRLGARVTARVLPDRRMQLPAEYYDRKMARCDEDLAELMRQWPSTLWIVLGFSAAIGIVEWAVR